MQDDRLPDESLYARIEQLKRQSPETEVLILSLADDAKRAYQAICAGASGYLVKPVEADRVQIAIDQIMDGGTVIDPKMARRFWTYFQSARRHVWNLTKQELEILQYLAKGLSNAEVGSMLAIGRRSVRTRLSHIYRKMGVRTHVEAVALAVREGLIEV